ncbi:MAG: AI-2E family transporter [Clostridiales bacterium]|nr:AI-2E family transporter [Clostridiales bacterium]
MENNWVTRNLRTITWVLTAMVAAAIVYSVRRSLLGTLTPFVYAAVFAYLFNPLINKLEARGVKRFWSSLLTVLLVFIALLALMALFIPSVISDATTVVRRLSLNVDKLKVMLEDALSHIDGMLGGALEVEGRVDDLVRTGVRLLTDAISRVVSSLGGLIDVLLIPVITFYLLKDKDLLLRDIAGFFGEPQRARLKDIGREINRLLSGYVKGKILISMLIGVLTGVGSLLIGVPNALTIGIVAGLFDLIPYFGPWLGGILPVLIALIGPTPIKALWVVILILIIQQVESNLITPRVISQRVGMHPLVVMFSVMFFGSVMGIAGMVLGVPIMAVLIALIGRVRRAGAPPHPAAPSPPAAPPQAAADEIPKDNDKT